MKPQRSGSSNEGWPERKNSGEQENSRKRWFTDLDSDGFKKSRIREDIENQKTQEKCSPKQN